MTNIVLASASPRRAELLRQIGLKFLIRPSNIEERRASNEEPADYVHRLSQEKAEHQAGSNAVVIAADTTVVVDNTVLEKPVDASDGVAMLMQLSGKVHEVMTGVTVSGDDRRLSQVVISTVAFKSFDQAVAERYWATGEPVDKAGGYAIQGLGSSFVEHLTGSYSNVMGLPLFETAAMLEQMGVDLF